MFYCPLCGRKFQEKPHLALEPGQTVLHCPVCEFTIRTQMSYRELYESLGPQTVQEIQAHAA